MENSVKVFPSYFPEGCPPENATSEEIILFRLCKSDVPSAEDFLTFYQLDPQKHAGNVQAYGLSVFPSEEDCDSAKRKSPRLRKSYSGIAWGKNDGEKGVILPTPNRNNPAHITWWIYEGIEPHTFFQSVGKVV